MKSSLFRFFLVTKSIGNIITENHEKLDKSQEMAMNIPIDENWFIKEVCPIYLYIIELKVINLLLSLSNFQAIEVIKSKISKQRIFEILCDIKSEQKLSLIYETTQNEFDVDLLSHLIESAIDTMIMKFKHDCFQHNPHMNYLKLSPILKQSINLLCNKMDNIFKKSIQVNDENGQRRQSTTHNCALMEIMVALRNLLKCILKLQLECMIYVEVASMNKFINEHIFRRLNFERLFQFALACLDFVESTHQNDNTVNIDDLTIACDCLTQIIRINFIFNESDNYFNTEKCHSFFNRLLVTLYEIVCQRMASQSFLEKNQLKSLLNKQSKNDADLLHAKAVFLGAFVENSFDASGINHSDKSHLSVFEDTLRSMIVATMRSDSFYFFAATPREIINSFDWQCESSSSNQTITFQSVPIDCLNEIEIVEKFLKRYLISYGLFMIITFTKKDFDLPFQF